MVGPQDGSILGAVAGTEDRAQARHDLGSKPLRHWLQMSERSVKHGSPGDGPRLVEGLVEGGECGEL